MSIATIGAFAIGDYPEGVAVMLFYAIGELFQNLALFICFAWPNKTNYNLPSYTGTLDRKSASCSTAGEFSIFLKENPKPFIKSENLSSGR